MAAYLRAGPLKIKQISKGQRGNSAVLGRCISKRTLKYYVHMWPPSPSHLILSHTIQSHHIWRQDKPWDYDDDDDDGCKRRQEQIKNQLGKSLEPKAIKWNEVQLPRPLSRHSAHFSGEMPKIITRRQNVAYNAAA